MITDKITIANEMLAVYREEESLLAATKNVKVSETNLSVAEIRAAADFYRERLEEVKMKKFDLNKEIKGWNKELVEIAKELRELNAVLARKLFSLFKADCPLRRHVDFVAHQHA